MHGRRTALRYSPSTPSPAGARSRGQSTVLPFGSGWSAPSPSWRVPGGRCVRVRGAHAIRGLKVPDNLLKKASRWRAASLLSLLYGKLQYSFLTRMRGLFEHD